MPPLWVGLIDLLWLSVMCVLLFTNLPMHPIPWTFGPLGPALRVRAGCTADIQNELLRAVQDLQRSNTKSADLRELKGGAGGVNSPRDQSIPTAVSGPHRYATANPTQPFPEPLGRNLPVSSRGDA
jgi:hypothetical protein